MTEIVDTITRDGAALLVTLFAAFDLTLVAATLLFYAFKSLQNLRLKGAPHD